MMLVRRAAIIVLGLLLLTTLAVAAWQAALQRTAPAMLVIAHRGDLDDWPENTLEAIVSARDAGADGVEFDVQRSRDGTWWVIHGPLDRTTTGHGRVAETSDAEISELSINGGLGYDGQSRLAVPRLTDVLVALDGWDGVLIVDVKTPGAEANVEVARIIGNSWMLIHDRSALTAVEEEVPEVVTILGFEGAGAMDLGSADGWSVSADLPILGLYTNILRPGHTSVVFVDEAHRGDESRPLQPCGALQRDGVHHEPTG